MYYLSNIVINRININNINLNKLILLEEKFLQLEKKVEDLEEFKSNYYQNSFATTNTWDMEMIETSDDEES